MRTFELPPPAALSACARAAEIATILARCILRQHAEIPNREGPVGLGFSPHQRVHTTPSQPEKTV